MPKAVNLKDAYTHLDPLSPWKEKACANFMKAGQIMPV